MPTTAPYPPGWKALVAQVRERSGDRCEWDGCGIPNGARIHRRRASPEEWTHCVCADSGGGEGNVGPEWLPAARIVLTTAHTCRTSTCADLAHLRHWCNRHHLLYDGQQHAANAAETRRKKRIARGQTAMEIPR